MVPVFLGKSEVAFNIATRLLKESKIYTVAIPYPVVPEGEARIRLIATASHTEE